MDDHTHNLAERLWYYHQLHHQLERADVILVLCSHDQKVAERGAQLFLEGWAPLLIFSGGLGVITSNLWDEPEADQFARIAIGLGVPKEKILVENQSTNTGENVRFTKQLLRQKQINPQKFIVVQKPYMERRSFATFRKVWPEKEVMVTSPRVSFDEYLDSYVNSTLTREDVVSIMVGDLQRIKLYPGKGFQIHQDIPVEVWSAYEELVRTGYNRHLIKDEKSTFEECK
ncbi:MAG TPA: YdcF family protein [Pyrinomonadaceae bacterium]|nr:YdcF family protein [Pyrinomonadaceae bacterium]